ncbi:MAG: hypothetical protein ABW077_04025 [Candidatus Thiodiazotropha endolucinida]
MVEITSIVVIGLLCVGLWWIYYFEYRRYLVDSTRQRLFDIREELFSKARQGIIDFNDPAYGMTRTTLNGMIQYTHDLCLTRLIIVGFTRSLLGPNEYVIKYKKQYKDAFQALESKSAKQVIATVNRDMHYALVAHVVKHSLFLLVVIWLFMIFAGAHGKVNTIRKRLVSSEQAQGALSFVDAEANQIGHSHC